MRYIRFAVVGTFLILVCAHGVNHAQTAPASDPAELLFWESIRNSTNPADFQEYLKQYPKGTFAGLARNKLKAADSRTAPQTLGSPEVGTYPRITLVSFAGDGLRTIHSPNDKLAINVRAAAESDVIGVLRTRFPNPQVGEASEPAIKIDIDVRESSYDSSCGIFSCSVKATSRVIVDISSPSGSHIQRGITLNVPKRSVSKEGGSFPPRSFGANCSKWISEELVDKLRVLMNDDEVRAFAQAR